MSVQPALAGRALERLFTPGIRLGWTFRDRNSLGTPFLEPHPDPGFIDKQIAERVAITQSRYARARRWVIKPSLVLGLVLLLLAGYKNGTHRAGAGYVLLAAAVIVTGSGLGYTIRSWWRKRRAAAARPERSYRKAVQAWQQRAIAHEQAELARAGNVPEWSAAGSPTLRTDVFGGSLAGWQALLITHGTSILAAGPLLVMDLSGQLASRELTSAAQAAAIPSATLPHPGCSVPRKKP